MRSISGESFHFIFLILRLIIDDNQTLTIKIYQQSDRVGIAAHAPQRHQQRHHFVEYALVVFVIHCKTHGVDNRLGHNRKPAARRLEPGGHAGFFIDGTLSKGFALTVEAVWGKTGDMMIDGDVVSDRLAVWTRRLADPEGTLTLLAEDATEALGVFGVSLTALNNPLTLVAETLKGSMEAASHWGETVEKLAQVERIGPTLAKRLKDETAPPR